MSEATPRLTVPVGPHDHVEGPADAPVTLVEYGDYQCPYCGQAYPVVKAVQKKLGAHLRFVFRNMPLNHVHAYAELAAESAEAAGAQGKFWEMHDALFEHQGELSGVLPVRLAKQIGLDLPRFEDDIRTRRFREHVEKDAQGGIESGVQGTPSFYIDGLRYAGPPTQHDLLAALKR